MELDPPDRPPPETAPPPSPAERLARWATASAPRRPAVSRLGLAAALAVVAVGLLGYGGSQAVGLLVAWLHRRPEYQLPWRQIVLDPAPPPWIRTGRLGLLERVRRQARWPEPLSVLDLDPADLARDFRNGSPWVVQVRRVERSYPNRLAVRLAYREPVAEARFGRAVYVVDGDAVFLPAEELDREAAGPLVRLLGLGPPEDGRPGLYWGHPAEPDPDAAAAARLAAFLKERAWKAETARPPPRPIAIRRREPDGALCILGADRVWICWGEAPGGEAPGRPSAAEKWEMLRAWARRPGPAAVADPDFLDFTREGVVVRRGMARTP
jgi:hypothetical protein